MLYKFVLEFFQSCTVTAATHSHNSVFVLSGEAVENLLLLLLLEAFFHLLESGVVINLTCHDVKLRAGRASFRVHLVTCASGSESTAFVEVVRVVYLSLDSVAGVTHSEHFSCGSIFRVGVTGLHHKLIDNTVEKHTVVVAFANEFEEIFFVFWSVAVKTQSDVA